MLIDDIKGAVVSVYGISLDDLDGVEFKHPIKEARWLCWYIIKEFNPNMTGLNLGLCIGYRDSSIALRAVKRVEKLLDKKGDIVDKKRDILNKIQVKI